MYHAGSTYRSNLSTLGSNILQYLSRFASQRLLLAQRSFQTGPHLVTFEALLFLGRSQILGCPTTSGSREKCCKIVQ